jgi:hypothetical protein
VARADVHLSTGDEERLRRAAVDPERAMGNIRHFSRRDILGPDDISVAVSAFEAALGTFDGFVEKRTTETLARYIVHRALRGERDADELREGALSALRRSRSARRASRRRSPSTVPTGA